MKCAPLPKPPPQATQELWDQYFMTLALKRAQQAVTRGEVPVGALLVDSDQNIVAQAHNLKESCQDPTAHAEILVLRQATQALGQWRLQDHSLYVTLEPCSMCAGALIQARIKRLIIGTMDPKSGACGSIYNLPQDERLNHKIPVTTHPLGSPCSSNALNY